MSRCSLRALGCTVLLLACAAAHATPSLKVPTVLLAELTSTIEVAGANGAMDLRLLANGEPLRLNPAPGNVDALRASLPPGSPGPLVLELRDADGAILERKERPVLAGIWSIAPPLLAFLLALVLRQVIPALFIAIWLGAFLIAGPAVNTVVPSLLQSVSSYAVKALTDSGHATLIIFTLMIGGLVAIISKNGGTRGIVAQITRFANDRRRGQSATYLMGLVFFFDDYANTLVVGKTMRPVTDALRISREKLAYLVDSTAAPVATLALISSWIGFQLGLVGDAINKIDGLEANAYGIFLNSLAYNFYPMLTLFFVALIAATGRDFGAMARVEHRALATGELTAPGATLGDDSEARAMSAKEGIATRAVNAYLPLATLIVVMLAGLYITGVGSVGADQSLRTIIGASDSYLALLWSTLSAVIVAVALSLGQRLLTLAEAMDAWFVGCKAMLLAVIVLVMAWTLSNINEELRTAEYLTTMLSDQIDARLLPAIVFAMAAFTAFATGTSWGVMGILLPIVIPLVWATAQVQGLEAPLPLIYGSVSAVLAGAVMGDHCSPISDTTILSSVATSCDLVDHVRTQLPYALLVGAVSLVFGLIPTAYGLPWYLALLLGIVVLVVVHRLLSVEPGTEPFPARAPQ
ncbi:MAG: Na+/H+ antiporter NhaC family protein [Pseudomonadota bacterium]